jgi:hypothetical protein
MVRSALFVSLLATITGAIARGAGQASKIVPGAYIFEFENDHVSYSLDQWHIAIDLRAWK